MKSPREALLDAAVRQFQKDNPLRGYCTCFGCVVSIVHNFRVLERRAAEKGVVA